MKGTYIGSYEQFVEKNGKRWLYLYDDRFFDRSKSNDYPREPLPYATCVFNVFLKRKIGFWDNLFRITRRKISKQIIVSEQIK